MQASEGGRPIHYLEIGVQEGHSLVSVLRNPDVALAVGIDIWNADSGGTNRGSPDHIPVLCANDMRRVVIISGDSHHVLPGIRHPFDVIFVDGDHSKEGCLNDLTHCLVLLKDSGIENFTQRARMLVDDLEHPKHTYLREAVETWAKEHNMTFEYSPTGYGVGILQRSVGDGKGG